MSSPHDTDKKTRQQLYRLLFGSDEDPPAKDRDAAVNAVTRQSHKKRARIPVADALRRLGTTPADQEDAASRTTLQDLRRTLGIEEIQTEDLYGADECELLDIPELSGVGGRRRPPYPIATATHSATAKALASSPTLYVDAEAGCLNEVVWASASLGFWIFPRFDFSGSSLDDVVVRAHLVGRGDGTVTGAGILSVGWISLIVGSVDGGRFQTLEHTKHLLFERGEEGEDHPTVPDDIAVSLRVDRFKFYYAFLCAHVRAEAPRDLNCKEVENMAVICARTPELCPPQEERPLLSTASASINLAVCAVDVTYEPVPLLTVPEALERERAEALRERVRRLGEE